MASSGALHNNGADLALNLLFRNSGTSPTTVYLGLATGAITRTSTAAAVKAIEAQDANYSRQAITFAAPAEGSGNRAITNSAAAITFGGAGFATGNEAITYAFITDTSGTSDPNVLFFFNLGLTKNTNQGETLVVNTSNLTVTLV